MKKLLEEGNLQFDFSAYPVVERFDVEPTNPQGMKCVDFFAENNDYMCFIEVKDFQNPNATTERRKSDYEMLITAVTAHKSIFSIEMGEKIKDSLLRKYSLGDKVNKKVVYLLLINLDKLGEFERGLLKARISGHVPTGLNNDRFCAFTEIIFDLVDIRQLKAYGITCTVI